MIDGDMNTNNNNNNNGVRSTYFLKQALLDAVFMLCFNLFHSIHNVL